jgi:hypothetical protein
LPSSPRSPYSAILVILQDDMDLLFHGQPKKGCQAAIRRPGYHDAGYSRRVAASTDG